MAQTSRHFGDAIRVYPGRPSATKVLAGLVGLGLAAGFITHDRHAEYHTTDNGDRRAAYAGIDTTRKLSVVVKAGAMLRFTPEMLNGDVGAPSNRARRVQEGKELVITEPARDKSHPGWVAFTEPGVDPRELDSSQEGAEHTLWINLDQLVLEGYAREIPGATATEAGVAPTHSQLRSAE